MWTIVLFSLLITGHTGSRLDLTLRLRQHETRLELSMDTSRANEVAKHWPQVQILSPQTTHFPKVFRGPEIAPT